jgi:peroxiredoxin
MFRTALLCVLCLSAAPAFALDAGDDAPEIKAEGWCNSEGVSLKGLREKIVVLEFWATWCGPCKENIPHMNEMHDKYKDKNVVVVGITDEKKDKVEKFVQKMGMNYVVAAGCRAGADYEVTGIPHAVVIGPDGKIVYMGYPDDDMEAVVRLLVARSSPEAAEEMKAETEIGSAKNAIAAAEFATAIFKLRKVCQMKVPPASKTAAEKLLREIEAQASAHLKQAAGKKPVDACKVCMEVALIYAGTESAAQAKIESDKLMADPAVRAAFHPKMK